MARRVVVLCFLLSGATALAYEIIWLRQLTLIFGATVLGAGCVLAAYMAGLACGNAWWAPRADRAARPLRLYAQLEFGVALGAAVTPWLFDLVRLAYRHLFTNGVNDFEALSLVRFVLCLPALLLPTFLMGGTLPVLVRFYTRSVDRFGRGTGDLYAVNTLGATLGTLVTGFVLLPQLGVRGSLAAAVAVNLLVALLAWWLSARQPQAEWERPPLPSSPPEPALLPTVRMAWVCFGVSGLAAMFYEVAWTRGLIQIFGNSTYAFTTMLASFLVGLAVGAAAAARCADRLASPLLVLAAIQALVGTWAAAVTPLIEWLPPLFLRTYSQTGGAFGAVQFLQFKTCFLLMLPTTAGLGAVLPLVSRASLAATGGAGRSVGVPLAWNTVGTVVGALTAGFLLLPRVGIERTIGLGALLNIAAAMALLLVTRRQAGDRRPTLLLAGLGLLAVTRLVVFGLDPRVLAAGVYMYPEFFLAAREAKVPVREAMQQNRVVHYREGYSSSIAVLALPDGLALQTNGKTDASTGDLASQRLQAHLPLLLKPEARKVMVVGLASGCTAGSALLHPLERLDCVEIEPAMLPAARYFDPWNHRALDDPRLHVLLQDARNYVLMSRERYDVITAEPTNPWIAGVNNLFTLEYFQDCRRRLKPGGLMCQWMPAYNFTPDELRAVLATYQRVFPYVTVWAFPKLRTDFFAVGSTEPVVLDPAAIAARLQGKVLADAAEVGILDLWRLVGGLVLDEPSTAEFCRGGRLNTDDYPFVEFTTPRHLYQRPSRATVLEAYRAGAGSRLRLTPAATSAAARLAGAGDYRGGCGELLPLHEDLERPTGTLDTAGLRLGDRLVTPTRTR
ncbi:MAG: fused MFS/spermidine synthase [Armatimonadetes bacterium]|nr:fused MFS/spermidine synthase [Armatimonadota bacterium]